MIKINYNIEPKKIIEKENSYQFNIGEIHFILYPFFRSEEELKDIFQITKELKTLGLPLHTFIENKEGKLVTKIYERNFVLLKIEENPKKEYNLLDIINIKERLHLTKQKSELYRNQWGKLWSDKIDYFEYQMHELGKNKKVILNSFPYYLGLAENAISYVTNTTDNYKPTEWDRITLSHKRITFPNYAEDYFNPLLFIFDLEVRDAAEYIKSIFFKEPKEAWIELKSFLNCKRLSIYGYQMFYARLLYPSYYFDIYEQIMNNKKEEEELIPYIKQASSYEEFLWHTFLEISQKVPLEKIEWLNQKKEL